MKYSIGDKPLLVGLVLFVAVAVASCVSDVPYAIDAEVQNQRHIAAGSWKHFPGYYEYTQLAEGNK